MPAGLRVLEANGRGNGNYPEDPKSAGREVVAKIVGVSHRWKWFMLAEKESEEAADGAEGHADA